MKQELALEHLKRIKKHSTTHEEKESLNIAIQYLKLHLNSEYGQMTKKGASNHDKLSSN